MRVSSDGVLWSAPRDVRPDGSANQTVWASAAEPNGHLLVIVGDSGSPSEDLTWKTADETVQKLPAAVPVPIAYSLHCKRRERAG